MASVVRTGMMKPLPNSSCSIPAGVSIGGIWNVLRRIVRLAQVRVQVCEDDDEFGVGALERVVPAGPPVQNEPLRKETIDRDEEGAPHVGLAQTIRKGMLIGLA